jgi:hypothetical protein
VIFDDVARLEQRDERGAGGVLVVERGANLGAVRQGDRAAQPGADLRLDAHVEVAVERLAVYPAALTDRVPGQLGVAQLPGRDARGPRTVKLMLVV